MRSLALILFTLAVVCPPTYGAPPPKLDVTFTIPKDFTGILVMVFNMPGGLIFDKEYDIANAPSHQPESITVDFDLDGLARIGRQTLPFGEGKQIIVEQETNKEIPLTFRTQDLRRPLPPRAALTDGGTLILLKDRKEFSVQLFLVGDPSKFPAIFDHKQHAVQIAATLSKHFGLPVTPESLFPSDEKK